ncbi:MAG: hypothetical protein AAGF45_09595 [Pseudomonadota bacterium]
MNTFHRAAFVSGVVSVLFVALTAVIAVPLVSRGVPFEAMVPMVMGSTVKGLLAAMGAAVFLIAARMETRRQAMAVAAQPAPAGAQAVNDNVEPPLAA